MDSNEFNYIIKSICSRRSCRKFQDKPIPEDDLIQIMAAAINAPTAMNKQGIRFTVINNRIVIQELAAIMAKYLDNPNYNMYEPQVLVIPSVSPELDYGVDDTSAALENIFLASHALGIGSCWINQLRRVIQNQEVRDKLTALGIPEDHTVYGMAALGYAAQEYKPIERTEVVNFIK